MKFDKLVESIMGNSQTLSLRNPNITDEEAAKLLAQSKELKEKIKQIESDKRREDYFETVDPQGRVAHDKILKQLHAKLRAIKNRYYGGW
jgi:hypothetical protein